MKAYALKLSWLARYLLHERELGVRLEGGFDKLDPMAMILLHEIVLESSDCWTSLSLLTDITLPWLRFLVKQLLLPSSSIE